ncbi:tudor domain-containing protein 3 isoform x1 [Limosa lapponica baueri]|uniref:Tudor domain-containing protein 3 isoform x1 n=1 Tax=Limosa lapponica baueri TaxID=1758121 RepID=A0A2I0U1E6_LIMLA|nr:tudor domain-containing protein 3 isoform x1 [Limosa lapponica baueri]
MGDSLQCETISNLTGCKHFTSKFLEFKMNFEKDLEWYLSDEGIEACISSTEKVNTNDIILVALNTDLRTIGKKFLPSDINGGKVEKVMTPDNSSRNFEKLEETGRTEENCPLMFFNKDKCLFHKWYLLDPSKLHISITIVREPGFFACELLVKFNLVLV